jgi:hypothetical protein
LDNHLFTNGAQKILQNDNFTNEDHDLITDAFLINISVHPDITMPEEYIEEFEKNFIEISSELNLEEKEMKDRVSQFNKLIKDAKSQVTQTAKDYLKAIQKKDFATVYDMIYTDAEKEQFIKENEELHFTSDYSLEDYEVFAVTEHQYLPLHYEIRVGMKSTSTAGDSSTILIFPINWDLLKNKWMIDAANITLAE